MLALLRLLTLALSILITRILRTRGERTCDVSYITKIILNAYKKIVSGCYTEKLSSLRMYYLPPPSNAFKYKFACKPSKICLAQSGESDRSHNQVALTCLCRKILEAHLFLIIFARFVLSRRG